MKQQRLKFKLLALILFGMFALLAVYGRVQHQYLWQPLVCLQQKSTGSHAKGQCDRRQCAGHQRHYPGHHRGWGACLSG